VCGLGADGDRILGDGQVVRGRRFTEFRIGNADAVDAGRVYTRRDEPGTTATTVRGADGSRVAVRHEHMLICSECIKVAARFVGLSDSAVVERELDEQRQRAEKAEATIAERDQAIATLEDGIRVTAALTRILEAEKSTRRSPRGRK